MSEQAILPGTDDADGVFVNKEEPKKRGRPPKTPDAPQPFKSTPAGREHALVEEGMVVQFYQLGDREPESYVALVVAKYDNPPCLDLKVFDRNTNRTIYCTREGVRHVDDPASRPDKKANGGWELKRFEKMFLMMKDRIDELR